MNTTTSRGLAAAGLLATALVGLVHVPAAQAAAPEWKRERGIVLECAGDAHGVQVWTSVYENQRYGNTVQVVIGDPDDGNGNSKNTEDKFVVDGVVKATVKVDGKRALSRASSSATALAPRVRGVRGRRLPHQDPRVPPPAAHRHGCPVRRHLRPAGLRHRLRLRPRGQEDPDRLSAAGIVPDVVHAVRSTKRQGLSRFRRVTAGDLDVGVVGDARVDEGGADQVADRAVGAAVDVEGLAAVVAEGADDRAVRTYLELVGVLDGRRARCSRRTPWCQRSSSAVLPQNQRPGTPAIAAGTSAFGRQASTSGGTSSPSSTPGTRLHGQRRRRRWPAARCRCASQRSTNSEARNPGIEPVWPAYVVPSTSMSRSPSPYPGAGACRVAISSSVDRASTSAWPVARKSAHRARSAIVLHTCPAGAIAPVSWCGSSVSVSWKWCTLYALRVRRLRQVRRPRHAQGREQLGARPRRTTTRPAAATPPRRAARSRGWSSGSTPPGSATRPEPSLAVSSAGTGTARRAFPPRADGLALHPGHVGEQVADRRRGVPRLRHEPTDRVRERQQPLVAQPHHGDGDQGLGDRADAVLRVVGRTGYVARAADPRRASRPTARRPRPTAAGRDPWSRDSRSSSETLG